MPNPVADFTPHDVDLLLKKNSYQAVPFTFEATDFTGFTNAEFRWIEREDTSDTPASGASLNTVAMTITPATDSIVEVVFDAAAWTTVGTIDHGLYEVTIQDGSGNLVYLAEGQVDFEDSLS